MEEVILVQPEAVFAGQPKMVMDNSLWQSYLYQACRLRGEIFYDEGLLDREGLSGDGRESDDYDELGTHFLIFEGEKAVGALRLIEYLSVNKERKEMPLQILFHELNLRGYETAHQRLLAELVKKKKRVAECSRLVVKEEYRRFRNIHSQVAMSLITSAVQFFRENHIDDIIITSGTKYKTAGIYKRIGFEPLSDPYRNCPLEPFYYKKFNDYAELMHCPLEKMIENLSKFINRLRPVYQGAKVIKKSED